MPTPLWLLTHPTQLECVGYLFTHQVAHRRPTYEVIIECGKDLLVRETYKDRTYASARLDTHRAMLQQRGWTLKVPDQSTPKVSVSDTATAPSA